jgi:putative transposase
MFAGWVNRQQLEVIEYLKEENRLLRERLAAQRIRFTDAERRRLARKAQALGQKALSELETLVTPDTLLRWYRTLIECVAATDFFTVEVCTRRRLVTHYVLFLLDLATRSVKIAGVTTHPCDQWMTQIARNLTDPEEEPLRGMRFLIMDRDTKYSDAFRSILTREGLQVIGLPPRSPNLNAFAERFVRSVKGECLDRMIFFGGSSLQRALAEYIAHYHHERNHQGVGNRLLQSTSGISGSSGPIRRRERLGGMLSFYHRTAAA